MHKDLLKKVEQYSKKCFSKDKDSAHNYDHVMRVYNLALKLAEGENVDLDVLKISTLLHDIGGPKEIKDPTGKTDHAVEGAKMAERFLRKLNVPEEKVEHIKQCIITHRYKTDKKPKSLEAKILFDADKLETVGAIGIAREYIWIGKNNGYLYKKMNIKEYARQNLEGGKINGRIKDKSKHSPQIDWETKNKLLLKVLYTDKAKEIAKKRMKFSGQFLDKLEREVKGLD